MKFKYFQHPLSFKQMEEVMSSSLQGFVMKRIWIHGNQKAKMKVWGSPFIPSHLTFKSFEYHSLSVNQSHNNPTNNQICLFIITFQNLEFWDVTNLPPLKWISSSRFGEARKKRLGFGGLLKIHWSSQGSGVLPPLKAWLRFHQNSYTPFLLLTGPVFSNSRENSFSGLFR